MWGKELVQFAEACINLARMLGHGTGRAKIYEAPFELHDRDRDIDKAESGCRRTAAGLLSAGRTFIALFSSQTRRS